VATALALGGPGAIFWMWVVALVGMATKFSEAALGLKYRHVADDGHVSGGAFYYIERGLGWRPLALLYALLAGVASFGIGNMVQANTMAHALETGFAVPLWTTGLVAMALVGAVTLGGIGRIGKTAERIVPFMALRRRGAGARTRHREGPLDADRPEPGCALPRQHGLRAVPPQPR
jgi:alanine or glycine:cation symporter, AGCS family